MAIYGGRLPRSVLSGSSALTWWILGPCLLTHRLTNRHLTDGNVRLIDLGHLGLLQNGDTLLLSGRILGGGKKKTNYNYIHIKSMKHYSGKVLEEEEKKKAKKRGRGGTSSGSRRLSDGRASPGIPLGSEILVFGRYVSQHVGRP